MTADHPFSRLTPDFIMDAIESVGYHCDARILELNSYENRVYQVGIEDQEPLIAKFYRPDRWSFEQINEEHTFTAELADHGLSVVAPLLQPSGLGSYTYEGFHIALFPRRGGRAPAVDDLNCLEILGRFIARLHNVGGARTFRYRPEISLEDYGTASRQWLLENDFLPAELRESYESVSANLLSMIESRFREVSYQRIRLHADCHMGNVLWRDDAPHFVDFDDARSGAAVQDLWMLLSGDEETRAIGVEWLRQIVRSMSMR